MLDDRRFVMENLGAPYAPKTELDEKRALLLANAADRQKDEEIAVQVRWIPCNFRHPATAGKKIFVSKPQMTRGPVRPAY